MTENAKDRKNQFRKPMRESTNQKGLFLLVGGLRFCLGMLGGTTATFCCLGETKPREQGFRPGKLKELALLKEKGLPEKAIEAYKWYLDRTTPDDNSRAAICCSIGKLTAVRLIDKTLELADVKFLPERLEPFRK